MQTTNKTLRHMAWERAKGELHAMMQTYYADREDNKYEEMLGIFMKFVHDIETQGLAE